MENDYRSNQKGYNSYQDIPKYGIFSLLKELLSNLHNLKYPKRRVNINKKGMVRKKTIPGNRWLPQRSADIKIFPQSFMLEGILSNQLGSTSY
jgi:hypothetical protein